MDHSGSATWDQFHKDFSALASQHGRGTEQLWAQPLLDDGESECDVDVWHTSAGTPEIKDSFELLALNAGSTLGYVPSGCDPLNYWLHRVAQFLSHQTSNSRSLKSFCYTDQAGRERLFTSIMSVCGASAAFS